MGVSKQKSGSQVAADLSKEIKGKIILTTGVSPGGLGSRFVETIAQFQPALLILAGRSQSKLQETQSRLSTDVNSRLLLLDLSSQEQIRKAAKEVLMYSESIDVLVNNAGIMATPYGKTKDGIEMQFGCNHIGHFLFTNLIISKLQKSNDHDEPARIINVSSDGYRLGPVRFQDYNFQDGAYYEQWKAYGQSKSANMLFTVELAKRLKSRNILSFSLHPGVIKTNLSSNLDTLSFQNLFTLDKQLGFAHRYKDDGSFTYLTLDEGVATHIFAAFQPDLQKFNGRYLESCRVLPLDEVHCWGRDAIEAEKLWKLSEETVNQSFQY